jgi:DNA-nicking Smr family endonuclease
MTRNDDEKIWAEYAKGVKRAQSPRKTKSLPRHPRASGDLSPEASVKKKPAPAGLAAKAGRWMAASAGMTPVLFDRRMERKLRAGDIIIEARLDMHGMTQKEAYAALTAFIAAQAKASARNLLVITGKGRGGDGVLKSSLAGWLENLPDAARILAVRPAAIKHGGAGAFYVILRRAS